MATNKKQLASTIDDNMKSRAVPKIPKKDKFKKLSGFPNLNISLNMNQNTINSFFSRNDIIPKTCANAVETKKKQTKSVVYSL